MNRPSRDLLSRFDLWPPMIAPFNFLFFFVFGNILFVGSRLLDFGIVEYVTLVNVGPFGAFEGCGQSYDWISSSYLRWRCNL